MQTPGGLGRVKGIVMRVLVFCHQKSRLFDKVFACAPFPVGLKAFTASIAFRRPSVLSQKLADKVLPVRVAVPQPRQGSRKAG